MRYDRSSLKSSTRAAVKLAMQTGKSIYVYGTALGFVVTPIKPIGQRYAWSDAGQPVKYFEPEFV